MGNLDNQHTDTTVKDLGKSMLTVKELANLIEETPNIVRNWIKDLKEYIPLNKNEAGYNVFDADAIEKMKLIKHLHRERNYSIKQIEHYFATGGEAYTLAPQKGADELLAEELNELREQIKNLEDYNKKQEEFNRALIEKLDNQGEYIDKKLDNRDKLLMESIREIQETKELIAASDKEAPKKKWFQFWK
ncbi:DUF3967 domain-containing protein [Pseudalkalibacillus hwajinpoensis]|uniref:DUF3967 domain-containing protein n=1 Tax=Guptibacillus hwajinpoensis TaxID=208199 RepID=A0A4U1M533_9BACL|nr:DUF3967 domain-containing protein [Pseudalkalibacillus hwajinpoensis]TKD65707.1 DUF3967 domain-containing protein [Pseudalkalibacillus hwajinpoensis]